MSWRVDTSDSEFEQQLAAFDVDKFARPFQPQQSHSAPPKPSVYPINAQRPSPFDNVTNTDRRWPPPPWRPSASFNGAGNTAARSLPPSSASSHQFSHQQHDAPPPTVYRRNQQQTSAALPSSSPYNARPQPEPQPHSAASARPQPFNQPYAPQQQLPRPPWARSPPQPHPVSSPPQPYQFKRKSKLEAERKVATTKKRRVTATGNRRSSAHHRITESPYCDAQLLRVVQSELELNDSDRRYVIDVDRTTPFQCFYDNVYRIGHSHYTALLVRSMQSAQQHKEEASARRANELTMLHGASVNVSAGDDSKDDNGSDSRPVTAMDNASIEIEEVSLDPCDTVLTAALSGTTISTNATNSSNEEHQSTETAIIAISTIQPSALDEHSSASAAANNDVDDDEPIILSANPNEHPLYAINKSDSEESIAIEMECEPERFMLAPSSISLPAISGITSAPAAPAQSPAGTQLPVTIEALSGFMADDSVDASDRLTISPATLSDSAIHWPTPLQSMAVNIHTHSDWVDAIVHLQSILAPLTLAVAKTGSGPMRLRAPPLALSKPAPSVTVTAERRRDANERRYAIASPRQQHSLRESSHTANGISRMDTGSTSPAVVNDPNPPHTPTRSLPPAVAANAAAFASSPRNSSSSSSSTGILGNDSGQQRSPFLQTVSPVNERTVTPSSVLAPASRRPPPHPAQQQPIALVAASSPVRVQQPSRTEPLHSPANAPVATQAQHQPRWQRTTPKQPASRTPRSRRTEVIVLD